MNVSFHSPDGNLVELMTQETIRQNVLQDNVEQIHQLHHVVLDSPVVMVTTSVPEAVDQFLHLDIILLSILEISVSLQAFHHSFCVQARDQTLDFSLLPDGPQVAGKVETARLEDQHEAYPLVVGVMPTASLLVRSKGRITLHVVLSIFEYVAGAQKHVIVSWSNGVGPHDEAMGINELLLRTCAIVHAIDGVSRILECIHELFKKTMRRLMVESTSLGADIEKDI